MARCFGGRLIVRLANRIGGCGVGRGIPLKDYAGDLSEAGADFGMDVDQFFGHALDARSVFHGRLGKFFDELERLHKVMVGGASKKRMDGLGNPIGRSVFDVEKYIKAARRHRQTIRPAFVFRPKHDHAFCFDRLEKPGSVVAAVAEINMQIRGAVNEIDVADRSGTIIGSESILTRSFGSHRRNAHHSPNVDDHFWITNQKQIQIRIGLNGRDWQSTIDASSLGDRADIFRNLRIELIKWDCGKRLLPSGARRRALRRFLSRQVRSAQRKPGACDRVQFKSPLTQDPPPASTQFVPTPLRSISPLVALHLFLSRTRIWFWRTKNQIGRTKREIVRMPADRSLRRSRHWLCPIQQVSAACPRSFGATSPAVSGCRHAKKWTRWQDLPANRIQIHDSLGCDVIEVHPLMKALLASDPDLRFQIAMQIQTRRRRNEMRNFPSLVL